MPVAERLNNSGRGRGNRPLIPTWNVSYELRRVGYIDSADLIDRLWVNLRVLKFPYSKARVLTGPIVYVWMRHSVALYVGSSRLGGARCFDPRHHRLKLREGDRLDVFPMESEEQARGVERDLIYALQPKFNGAARGEIDDPPPPAFQEPLVRSSLNLPAFYQNAIERMWEIEYARAEGAPS